MNYTDADKIKTQLVETSNRGFAYFLKNVALILLVLVAVFLVSHPEILTNPSAFAASFDRSSIWTIVLLFFIFGGIYQLSKSISHENRVDEQKLRNKNDEKRVEDDTKRHTELVMYRMEIGTKISNILKDVLIDTGGHRASVFEMHNGTNNLSGVPFLSADMNYEEVDSETDYMSDEFKDFNLTKYPFLSEIFKDGYWVGSIDEISKSDRKLACKLKMCGSTYIGGMLIYGENNPLGFITVSYGETDDYGTKEKIISDISQAAQKISVLLDRK